MAISVKSGELVRVRNKSALAVRYRVVLRDAGEVEFDVLPGAEFAFRSFGFEVDLSIVDVQTGGLRVVTDAEPGGD